MIELLYNILTVYEYVCGNYIYTIILKLQVHLQLVIVQSGFLCE